MKSLKLAFWCFLTMEIIVAFPFSFNLYVKLTYWEIFVFVCLDKFMIMSL